MTWSFSSNAVVLELNIAALRWWSLTHSSLCRFSFLVRGPWIFSSLVSFFFSLSSALCHTEKSSLQALGVSVLGFLFLSSLERLGFAVDHVVQQLFSWFFENILLFVPCCCTRYPCIFMSQWDTVILSEACSVFTLDGLWCQTHNGGDGLKKI